MKKYYGVFRKLNKIEVSNPDQNAVFRKQYSDTGLCLTPTQDVLEPGRVS